MGAYDMATLKEISVEHAIRGRVRLKYRRMKANPDLARDPKDKLSAIEGMTKVDTHTATGGVVMHYHPAVAGSAEFVLKIAAAFGLAAVDINPEAIEEWLQIFSKEGDSATLSEPLALFGRLVETGIANLNRREFTVGIVLPVVLTVLGVRSVLISEQLKAPSWYEYFWFAFGTYYTLNKPESPGDAAT
jgi:Heavy metal associated domain 2